MASALSEDHYGGTSTATVLLAVHTDEAAASVLEISPAEAGEAQFAPVAQAERQEPAPRSPTAYRSLEDMALCMVTEAPVSAMVVIWHNPAKSKAAATAATPAAAA